MRSTTDEPTVGKVFVAGKMPSYTYVARDELKLESRLDRYLDDTGTILTVAGPTKTGKTVLLRKKLDNPVWLDGQYIASPEQFWNLLAQQLGIATESSVTNTNGQYQSRENDVGVPSLAQYKTVGGENTGVSVASTTPVNQRGEIIDTLLREDRCVVVDDFHFLPLETQKLLVRALKPVVFEGVGVIFISTSHHLEDVISAEYEMNGRSDPLFFPPWDLPDLINIAERGFDVLNIDDPDNEVSSILARESYGNPLLMQQYCREYCRKVGIASRQSRRVVLRKDDDFSEFFAEQFDQRYARWSRQILAGAKQRGKMRTEYVTKSGLTLDNYGLTLAAISGTNAAMTIPASDIKKRVSLMVPNGGPKPERITATLKQFGDIAAEMATGSVPENASEGGSSRQPILEYVSESNVAELHVIDPFFVAFLRWGFDLEKTLESLDTRRV